jgi:acetolactate synthase-1/2/3 large subunit
MDADIGKTREEWQNRCLHWKNIFPLCEERFKQLERVDLYHLSECISEVLLNNATVVTDAGLEELIIPSAVSFRKGQRCIHPASQGAMGYALPAAVGAYLASGSQTVAVIGDGSIMMNLQELQTIRFNTIPVKIFVINNNCYAVIRKRQTELFRTRTIGTDPANGVSCPSFQKVAECFDIPYVRIDASMDLHQRLAAVLATDGPALCEVMGVEDQDFIRNSYAKNSKNRVVQRPIEDQSPFLDRDIFLSEMIIEPLD